MGQHTVGYCANEGSGEKLLLREVQPDRDRWGVGTIGPGFVRRVRHGLDVCDSGNFGKELVR